MYFLVKTSNKDQSDIKYFTICFNFLHYSNLIKKTLLIQIVLCTAYTIEHIVNSLGILTIEAITIFKIKTSHHTIYFK